MLSSSALTVIAAPVQEAKYPLKDISYATNLKYTDLSSEIKLKSEANPRFNDASMMFNHRIGDSDNQALYWLRRTGPTPFIPYMMHLNMSYSEFDPEEKRTAMLLIQSHPTPYVLVFDAFKKNSLTSIEFLKQVLKQDKIEDKLGLIKKRAELYPNKYPGNVAVKLEQFGYGSLEIEPLADRFEKFKSILSEIQLSGSLATIKQRIIASTEPNIDDVNFLMKNSPLVSFELVQSLTEFGADVDLAFAQSPRDTRIFKYLLENGADIDQKDEYGFTLLHIAAKYGNEKFVELMLEHGANIDVTDNNGKTPLFIAAEKGKTEVVELLVNRGAEINTADKNGWTPVRAAAYGDYDDIVELLQQIDLENK